MGGLIVRVHEEGSLVGEKKGEKWCNCSLTKNMYKILDMVAQAFNPRIWEAEVGGSL